MFAKYPRIRATVLFSNRHCYYYYFIAMHFLCYSHNMHAGRPLCFLDNCCENKLMSCPCFIHTFFSHRKVVYDITMLFLCVCVCVFVRLKFWNHRPIFTKVVGNIMSLMTTKMPLFFNFSQHGECASS